MEIEGIVHLIGETQVVGSAGTFKKRTIVIATNEQYIQHIPIDFVQDKTEILDKYSKGQEVKVSVNVRGNEYQGKYYVSLNGWRIEKLSDAPAATPTPEAVPVAQFAPAPKQPAGQVPDPADSDLPF
jgi:hypothetical protein